MISPARFQVSGIALPQIAPAPAPAVAKDTLIAAAAYTCPSTGPLGPGPLIAPPIELSTANNPVPYTPPSSTAQELRELATIGAASIGGQVVGGVVGQALIPVPVVGAEIGVAVGGVLGGLAGWAWTKL